MYGDKNIFAKAYAEAAKPTYSLYGTGEPVAEYEVFQAYAEFAEQSAAMDRQVMLYAEEAGALQERKNLSVIGALFYAEAEGGFFKKILNALVKLYEKAKAFIIKLLGRFKSTKSYREDILYIKSVLDGAVGYNYNENATLQVKKTKYAAVSNLVAKILDVDNGTLIKGELPSTATNKNTLEELNKKLKELLSKDNFTKTKVQDVITSLEGIQAKANDVNKWLKAVYLKAIGTAETGSAKFGETDPMTPAEAVNKLWDSASTNHRGAEIKEKIKEVKAAFAVIDYDNIAKSLEQGQSAFTNHTNDFKDLLNEVENKSVTARDSSDETEKAAGAEGATLATRFSKVATDYSTVAITAFSTAKNNLDRLLVELKAFAGTVDKLRQSAGNKASNDNVKETKTSTEKEQEPQQEPQQKTS